MLHLQYFNEYACQILSLNAIWRIYRSPTMNQHFHNIIFVFLPPANEVWGKVIFLHLCVILFIGGVCFPACITGHMTRGSASVGGLHLWGLHWGSASGGFASGGSASGEVCIWEGESAWGGADPYPEYYGIWSISGGTFLFFIFSFSSRDNIAQSYVGTSSPRRILFPLIIASYCLVLLRLDKKLF